METAPAMFLDLAGTSWGDEENAAINEVIKAGRFTMGPRVAASEVYGQVDPKNIPLTEDCPINPSSSYAVSKVAQDLLGRTYHRGYGMKVIGTRMFAYLNPRRADLFATASSTPRSNLSARSGKSNIPRFAPDRKSVV